MLRRWLLAALGVAGAATPTVWQTVSLTRRPSLPAGAPTVGFEPLSGAAVTRKTGSSRLQGATRSWDSKFHRRVEVSDSHGIIAPFFEAVRAVRRQDGPAFAANVLRLTRALATMSDLHKAPDASDLRSFRHVDKDEPWRYLLRPGSGKRREAVGRSRNLLRRASALDTSIPLLLDDLGVEVAEWQSTVPLLRVLGGALLGPPDVEQNRAVRLPPTLPEWRALQSTAAVRYPRGASLVELLVAENWGSGLTILRALDDVAAFHLGSGDPTIVGLIEASAVTNVAWALDARGVGGANELKHRLRQELAKVPRLPRNSSLAKENLIEDEVRPPELREDARISQLWQHTLDGTPQQDTYTEGEQALARTAKEHLAQVALAEMKRRVEADWEGGESATSGALVDDLDGDWRDGWREPRFDVNVPSQHGRTLLGAAVLQRSSSAIRALVRWDASALAGRPCALELAAGGEDEWLLSALLTDGGVRQRLRKLETTLWRQEHSGALRFSSLIGARDAAEAAHAGALLPVVRDLPDGVRPFAHELSGLRRLADVLNLFSTRLMRRRFEFLSRDSFRLDFWRRWQRDAVLARVPAVFTNAGLHRFPRNYYVAVGALVTVAVFSWTVVFALYRLHMESTKRNVRAGALGDSALASTVPALLMVPASLQAESVCIRYEAWEAAYRAEQARQVMVVLTGRGGADASRAATARRSRLNVGSLHPRARQLLALLLCALLSLLCVSHRTAADFVRVPRRGDWFDEEYLGAEDEAARGAVRARLIRRAKLAAAAEVLLRGALLACALAFGLGHSGATYQWCALVTVIALHSLACVCQTAVVAQGHSSARAAGVCLSEEGGVGNGGPGVGGDWWSTRGGGPGNRRRTPALATGRIDGAPDKFSESVVFSESTTMAAQVYTGLSMLAALSSGWATVCFSAAVQVALRWYPMLYLGSPGFTLQTFGGNTLAPARMLCLAGELCVALTMFERLWALGCALFCCGTASGGLLGGRVGETSCEGSPGGCATAHSAKASQVKLVHVSGRAQAVPWLCSVLLATVGSVSVLMGGEVAGMLATTLATSLGFAQLTVVHVDLKGRNGKRGVARGLMGGFGVLASTAGAVLFAMGWCWGGVASA